MTISRIAAVSGVWVMLLLGLLARLCRLDLMLYDVDEGVASIYALQFVGHGDVPLFGVRTSLGFYNPPLFIYLIAPAFLATKSPLFATAIIQCTNIGMIGLLTRRLWRSGWVWSCVALAVFACLSPGPLYLTNRLWGHALIPAFAIATFLLMLRCVENRNATWTWLLIPIAVSAAQQVHFSGALLLIDVVIGCGILKLRPNWRYLLGGCGIASASYVPYLIHEFRTGFVDLRAIAGTIGGSAAASDHSAIWTAAMYSLSDFGGGTIFQEHYPEFVATVPGYRAMRVILAFGFVLSVVIGLWRMLPSADTIESRRSNALLWLGFTWMVVPLLAFSVLKVVTVPAYWLIALPGPWIIAAMALEALMQYSPGRTWRWAGGVLLGVPVVVFFVYHHCYFTAVDKAVPHLIKYPTYRDQRDAVRYVCSDSFPKPVQLSQNNGTVGIDYQLLYLIAMYEGDTTRLRHPEREARTMQHYTINHHGRTIENVIGWERSEFGLLEVYKQPLPVPAGTPQTH